MRARRGAGVGMMMTPIKVAHTFRKLTKALKIPITGKMRLGWDQYKSYKLIARIVEENGGSLIALHGRTKQQSYSGNADWDAVAEIKSIVKIEFTDKQPKTLWNDLASNEYGFYANVNPKVDHPRWSQSSERILDKGFFPKRKPTLMFNGYEKEVAHLYKGLDLVKNY